MGEEKCPSGSSHSPIYSTNNSDKPHTINMKWTVFLAGMLMMARAAPVADPEAFGLPAIAIPAITGSALVDGLLLGKVALLKAAILANLLMSQGGSEEIDNSYGAPAAAYEEPAAAYQEPVAAPAPAYAPEPSYAPAQDSYGAPSAPVVDTYGSPAAAPLPSYNGY